MRMVFGLVLIIGFGLAGLAVYMTKGYLSDFESDQNYYQSEVKRLQTIVDGIVETADVYVVTRKMKFGEQLTRADVKIIKWPVDSLPDGIFKASDTEDPLFVEDEKLSRSIRRTMEINEPVLAIKISKPGQLVGIEERLSPGMRAFHIDVSPRRGVSGFLRPEHRVDISWLGKNRAGETIIQEISRNIRVLAIDGSTDDDLVDVQNAKTITIEVTPEEGRNLAAVQRIGKLHLSLLKTGDATFSSETTASRTSAEEVLGLKVEEAPQEVIEAEKKCYRTRRGIGTLPATEVEVPCPD